MIELDSHAWKRAISMKNRRRSCTLKHFSKATKRNRKTMERTNLICITKIKQRNKMYSAQIIIYLKPSNS